MKTFKELEEIGIVGTYTYKDYLHIITKDGNIWRYTRQTKQFSLYSILN